MNYIYCDQCLSKTATADSQLVGNADINWMAVLESQVPTVCPACGPIFAIAKIIERDDSIALIVRNIAAGACLGLLALAAAQVIEETFSLLRSAAGKA